MANSCARQKLDQLAREVQRHYPRIYVACHVDHRARRGQGPTISARDQTILAHVPGGGVRPRLLAAHLSVAPSTMSAALKRLVMLGLITMTTEARDGRAKIVSLTDEGKAALSKTSVLDPSRVRAALAQLSAADRLSAVRGLELLADAAQAARGGE
jgi:DNA-binding MarR family transcriptional regulator